jgi:hypothetical protein
LAEALFDRPPIKQEHTNATTEILIAFLMISKSLIHQNPLDSSKLRRSHLKNNRNNSYFEPKDQKVGIVPI